MTDQQGDAADETYETIDAEAANAMEQADSKVIYDALRKHKGSLDGSSELDADQERNLSEQIIQAATQRSQELKGGSASVSSILDAEGRPIPAWMWLLWVIAIVGAAVAIAYGWD